MYIYTWYIREVFDKGEFFFFFSTGLEVEGERTFPISFPFSFQFPPSIYLSVLSFQMSESQKKKGLN